jgi:hypothetical protein
MGKHYSVKEGNLYIFTTGHDLLLDLGVFPKELNLFESESDWRISPWIAVVENILQKTAEMAQIILQLNEYEKVSLSSKALENYFLDGNEQLLLETMKEASIEIAPLINLPDDAPS